ncbi:MAG: hypothetical protein DRO93_15065 [Candidatus Thorarchaeota archaeon]|nr:MAG: hypothetical protein DRO93_15065 [Candidatus Thorarchaeota archaeon]
MARSARFYLKAFLYFGGAAVILLGGAIVLMAPYHYIGFIATTGDACPFEIYSREGYFQQMEISVTVKPDNVSTVYVDFRVVNNVTLETTVLNMTLTEEDMVSASNPRAYVQRQVIDLAAGNYTIYVDRIEGASWIDVSYEQLSIKRNYIVTGGILNIVGLIMCISGYFVSGTLIPPDEGVVVEWGYDE